MADSISLTAKKGIAAQKLHSRSEKLAFLSGLIHTAGSLSFSERGFSLVLESENKYTHECFLLHVGELYKGMSVVSGGKSRTEANGEYLVSMLCDLGILDLSSGSAAVVAGIAVNVVKSDTQKLCYLRGAFLGSGSVSIKSGYHLEIVVSNERLASDIAAILDGFGIKCGTAPRKDKFIVYVKGAEPVSDTLALFGASRAVVEINEAFAVRQVNRDTNRATNCDLANITKSLASAAKQCEAIEKLILSDRLASLGDKLTEAAHLRLQYPELPLENLSEMANISKSGMRHRLNKLIELAGECDGDER